VRKSLTLTYVDVDVSLNVDLVDSVHGAHNVPVGRVAIIGGGYAGTAFAVHLSRQAKPSDDIVVVEPRERVGGGLAHSAVDPDHRLNAPDTIHLLYPDDDQHFRRWLDRTQRLAADPQAWDADGRLYPRRGDFGAYVAAEFAAHAAENPSRSTLSHRRGVAGAIERRGDVFRIEIVGGEPIEADRCVIAIGQEPAPLRLPGMAADGAGHAVIEDPFASRALAAIERDADVLILGTGLTSADAVAALVGQGHRGPISCISRRGLRPKDQAPPAEGPALWDRMAVQPPAFLQRHGVCQSALELLRIVRRDARERIARGEPWHGAIDEVRDAAGEIWRALPVAEKRRFLRHLKPCYDVHRFRIPPQTRNILAAAERRAQLRLQAGRVTGARRVADGIEVTVRHRGERAEQTRTYGALINCAGFSSCIERSRDPFIRSCLDGGLARPSDLGRGFDADEQGRVIAASGVAQPALYVLGATTLDCFGETPAAIFVLRQMLRILPQFIATTP